MQERHIVVEGEIGYCEGCTSLSQRSVFSIVGRLSDREVACSTLDRQGSNFESCVWRTVSSHSSLHSQEVLRAQFSLYEHKGGLKPDPFHRGCGVLKTPDRSLFSESDNTLPLKFIHSCGVVLVLSAFATLAQY